jgi:hypothetical protein
VRADVRLDRTYAPALIDLIPLDSPRRAIVGGHRRSASQSKLLRSAMRESTDLSARWRDLLPTRPPKVT